MIAAKEMRARRRADRRRGAAAGRRARSSRSAASTASSSVFADGARRASAQCSPAALAAFDARRRPRRRMKRVRFWGTRGSLPVALTAADVRAEARRARCAARRAARSPPNADIERLRRRPARSRSPAPTAATRPASRSTPAARTTSSATWAAALRPFGQAALARHGARRRRPIHIFMSHVHWDHIMGLPFFAPAYIPGNRVVIYGSHPELEAALRRQQDAAVVSGRLLDLRRDDRVRPPRARPAARHRRHERHARCCSATPATRTAIASRRSGTVVVYSTDSEHTLADPSETERFVEFFRDADLVIFDAMYSLADAISVKADWGHSSNVVGVELCQLARRAAPVPVPPRAGVRRRSDRRACSPTRGASRRSRARATPLARQRRLRRDGNRVVTPRAGVADRRAPDRTASASSASPILVALAALHRGCEPRVASTRCRSAWFDAYQALVAAQVASMPVDDRRDRPEEPRRARPVAVAAHACWRELVRRDQRAPSRRRSALDILMPEADALSPERCCSTQAVQRPTRARRAHCARCRRTMPMLARALAARAGGAGARRHRRRRPARRCARRRSPVRGAGDRRADAAELGRRPLRRRADAASTSSTARPAGCGLISVDPDARHRSAAFRSSPASTARSCRRSRSRCCASPISAPSLRLHASGGAVDRRRRRRLRVPTEADGAVRIYFSPHRCRSLRLGDRRARGPGRPGAAARAARADRRRPALGLLDYQDTPIGERMPGSEIHAQLLENLLDGTLLRRPRWAPRARGAAVAAARRAAASGRRRAGSRCNAALLMLGLRRAAGAASPSPPFASQRLLFDAATPARRACCCCSACCSC